MDSRPDGTLGRHLGEVGTGVALPRDVPTQPSKKGLLSHPNCKMAHFLTVSEAADVLRVSPKRLRNMMSSGSFREGYHFVRRPGLGPRFIKGHLVEWVHGEEAPQEKIPMGRAARGRRHTETV